ncbi:MAG: hypothetical protein B6I35_15865 [Anaerolineaceae bacterium 4572_32.2]|nr:MAG: hypothetical protein B6I35_15865 [Anaerolineaceae bacterium 4572_32.2]
MTTEPKVALVESVKDTYGLNFVLDVVELPKSTWYYRKKHKVDYEEKFTHLRPTLEEITRYHPEYGVPRIMPELLRDEYKTTVNHKVVERLLGTWDLSILRSTHRPRPSGIQRAITEAGGWPIWWLRWKKLTFSRWFTPILLNWCMQMGSGRPF